MRTIEATNATPTLRFAVVVSTYHDFITDRLQAGAVAALAAANVPSDGVTIVRVPGAFEVPMAARRAAESGQFDAVVCLGCLIRGATHNFEYIASAVAHGLMSAAGDTGVPMTFGVLTTNSVEEAIERAGEGPTNKGWEAAVAALEIATVVAQLPRSDRAV